MIAYIKGKLVSKSPTLVIIENNGMGFQVYISVNTYGKLPDSGEVTLLTLLSVRAEQAGGTIHTTIFGFADDAERSMFESLIDVSGVGPSMALVLLSSFTPQEVKAAIVGENENILRSAKGIGPKVAKRIILELKDKMLKNGDIGEATASLPTDNKVREEALQALLALGFQRGASQMAVNKILKSEPLMTSVEQLIKKALKELS